MSQQLPRYLTKFLLNNLSWMFRRRFMKANCDLKVEKAAIGKKRKIAEVLVAGGESSSNQQLKNTSDTFRTPFGIVNKETSWSKRVLLLFVVNKERQLLQKSLMHFHQNTTLHRKTINFSVTWNARGFVVFCCVLLCCVTFSCFVLCCIVLRFLVLFCLYFGVLFCVVVLLNFAFLKLSSCLSGIA